MKQKRMLFVFNPIAGKAEVCDNLYPVVDLFTRHGFHVTVHPTQEKRDAFQTVSRLGGDFDMVVGSGGDGTLNEVTDALMTLERRPLFGYIPAGTTNDFAHSLGIPVNIMAAADAICSGTPHAIDVGRLDGEYFTYVAAFGLFTDVSYDTSQSMKNMLGHAAYVLEGVKRLASIKTYPCTIRCNGEVIEDEFLFGMVTNSDSIGGFRLPASAMESGHLGFKLILVRKIRRFAELQRVVGNLLTGGKLSDSFVVRELGGEMQLTSGEPLKWTLDGEFGGAHQQTDITIHKKAISIMLPG